MQAINSDLLCQLQTGVNGTLVGIYSSPALAVRVLEKRHSAKIIIVEGSARDFGYRLAGERKNAKLKWACIKVVRLDCDFFGEEI